MRFEDILVLLGLSSEISRQEIQHISEPRAFYSSAAASRGGRGVEGKAIIKLEESLEGEGSNTVLKIPSYRGKVIMTPLSHSQLFSKTNRNYYEV